jgi:BirA family biotin operon repressor/biotin-[acetyl-CoA-carboxylase] ligase
MITRHSLVEVDQVPSTQDEARDRFEGIPLLVWAREQTSGRGRSGSEWAEAPRALATSLAFEPEWPAPAWGPLPLVAGLAACDAVGPEIGLKWPNDLILGLQKVGGILVEASGSVVVAGLGLNLWWPEPPVGIAGVFTVDPGETLGKEIAERWASFLLDRLRRPASDWGRDEYRQLSVTIGRDVAWDPDGAGRAVDVDVDGGLIVESGPSRITLRSGEVRNLRPGQMR